MSNDGSSFYKNFKGGKSTSDNKAKKDEKASTGKKPRTYEKHKPDQKSTESTQEELHLFKRVKVGQINVLRVVKRLPFGAYLSPGSSKGFDVEEILLPKRYEPEGIKVDDLLKVFIYYDSEDRIIATTETPHAKVDECAYLKVVDVNKVGAFMDMGLMKDLFIPYAAQETPMVKGESYVVHLHLDEHSGRIMGSSKLDKYLLEESHYHKEGQAVDLQIFAKTDLGYKAVIGTTYQGLLYNNEIFQDINIGDKFKGFISGVRADNRIDLSLQAPSHETRGDLANQILDYLKEQGGTITLTDKSSPEDIKKQFKVSKKAYKKALGALYKRRQIVIESDKVSLIEKSS